VEEAYRKQGVGSFALQSLTEIGLRLQCHSFCWLALEWNQPALDLYNKIGAEVEPGLLTHRYTVIHSSLLW
jgi:RimJ/RimL family protein N-acetyltransferase